MKAAGVDHFVEVGGRVLGPMVSRTVDEVTVSHIVSMADIEALAKEL
jgi:[acyl-carrier-protein] S-malonyltransferase